MPEIRPFKSGTVSAKLNSQEHDLLSEIYAKYFGDQETITFKEFLLKLMEVAQAPVNDQQTENADFLLIDELKAKVKDLEHQNFRITSELSIEKEKAGIPENTIIVPLEPVVNHFLTVMAEAATKKAKTAISKPDILKNLFWRQIVDGPGDHLPLIFTRANIAKEIERLKATAE